MAASGPGAQGGLETWEVKEPYLHAHCQLGEGPFYEKATNTLRFVDIQKHQLHSVDLTAGPQSLTTTQLDSPVGVTADIDGVDPQDRILVALQHGLAVLDRRSGKYAPLIQYFAQKNERLRSNDGGIDPHGRLWLGTMNTFGVDGGKEGHLLRLDSSQCDIQMEGIAIPNTIGWSPDGKTQYFTSTIEGIIYAWDYAAPPGNGAVTNKRIFYRHGNGEGKPDGFRVDVNGNLWHAFYGGACVLKISAAGKVLGKVSLPTRNITCVEFVGTELFITSAADENGEGKSKEFGGALFRVDVGTTGVEANKFKLRRSSNM